MTQHGNNPEEWYSSPQARCSRPWRNLLGLILPGITYPISSESLAYTRETLKNTTTIYNNNYSTKSITTNKLASKASPPLGSSIEFKLSLDSLGEICQLNYWIELNSRRRPLALLTSAQSGKHIVSSLLQPKDDISMQLKELLTNDMLIALFPYLHKLATICLSIPISTASAEQSFSDMKLIKNHHCNRLIKLSLSTY